MARTIKYFFFELTLLCCCILAFGQQSKIDSLKLILKEAKHDTTRLRLRNEIGEASSIFRIGYWDSLCDDAKKVKSKEIESLALNNIGYIYDNQGDIVKALYYYDRSLKINKEIGNKFGVAQSLNNIGVIYDNQGNISKALDYYDKSLKNTGRHWKQKRYCSITK